MPPDDTMSPPTSAWAAEQDVDGGVDRGALALPVGLHHQVALVAHDARGPRGLAGVPARPAGRRRRERSRNGAGRRRRRSRPRGCPAAAAASIVPSLSTATVIRTSSGAAATAAAIASRRRWSSTSLASSRSPPSPAAAIPSISAGVAQVKLSWPWRRCADAMAVHLWAFTCGRNRGPGRTSAMAARFCSKPRLVEDERRCREVGDVHALVTVRAVRRPGSRGRPA